jgi:hypothetical protein
VTRRADGPTSTCAATILTTIVTGIASAEPTITRSSSLRSRAKASTAGWVWGTSRRPEPQRPDRGGERDLSCRESEGEPQPEADRFDVTGAPRRCARTGAGRRW